MDIWKNEYLNSPTIGADINFSGISSTSVTVNWGAAFDNSKAQSGLEYKLVLASGASAIDTIAEADAVTAPDLIMDWTLNAVNFPVTGLSEATSYYFAVLVRDGNGNIALYRPQLVTTPDITAPAPGTAINFSAIGGTSVTVSWGAGTDNSTFSGGLSYKLIKAATAAAIDTVAEADAVTGTDLVMDWSINTLTYTATGLTDATSYYFAVLIEDVTGNMAIYNPQQVTTPDISAPVPGADIYFDFITDTTVLVQWGLATDNLTLQAALSYKLVKAISAAAIDTVAEADAVAAPDIAMNWTVGVGGASLIGLTAATTYYFAVLVRDGTGNMSIYSPQVVKTRNLALWAKSVSLGPGNSKFNSVSTDSSGNIYAAGYINGNGSYEFGIGPSITAMSPVVADNIILVKYDSTGAAQWAKTVSSGSSNSVFNSVTVHGSYLYAAGHIDGSGSFGFGGPTATGTNIAGNGYNILLVQYDLSGTAQWAKTVAAGTNDSIFYSAAVDTAGNIYAAGYINGTGGHNFGNGQTATGTNSGNNIILVKYGSSGNALWARTAISAPGNSAFYSVSVDGIGNVYAAGYIYGTGTAYDFGNGYTASGITSYNNILLVKYDTNGLTQWVKTAVSGPDESYFNSVSTDSSGNVYAAGDINSLGTYDFGNGVSATSNYSSGNNILIIKYDTAGVAQWAKSTLNAGSQSTIFNSVIVDSSGNDIYAVGRINNNIIYDFGDSVTAAGTYSGVLSQNIILVKYDKSGNTLWAQSLSAGTDNSCFNSVAVDSISGHIYSVGYLNGNTTFDFGNSVTTAGAYNSGLNCVIVQY